MRNKVFLGILNCLLAWKTVVTIIYLFKIFIICN